MTRFNLMGQPTLWSFCVQQTTNFSYSISAISMLGQQTWQHNKFVDNMFFLLDCLMEELFFFPYFMFCIHPVLKDLRIWCLTTLSKPTVILICMEMKPHSNKMTEDPGEVVFSYKPSSKETEIWGGPWEYLHPLLNTLYRSLAANSHRVIRYCNRTQIKSPCKKLKY